MIFYYDLPEELIAQTPLERRDASRLMTLDRKTGEVTHRHFRIWSTCCSLATVW